MKLQGLFAVLIALGGFLLQPASAAETAWPRASGDVDAAECVDAMHLARAMFQSSASRVYAPLTLPQDMASTLVLGAAEVDISGGDALVNAGGFDKLPQADLRSVYWEQAPAADARIVVRESSFGWRGDQYFLYLPNRATTQVAFLQALARDDGQAYATPVDGDWRPPLVFRFRSGGGLWFIRIGQPFTALGAWQVFGRVGGGYAQRCAIAFRPEVAAMGALLPVRVRRLLRQLDETLGPGNDEGTLQSTAGIRNGVQHVIANAALRPWAVQETDAYNTRGEVDAGLAAWALNAPRRALYRRITQAYAPAERALAAYYRRDLAMSQAAADAEAARVLDLLLRVHYVFPKH